MSGRKAGGRIGTCVSIWCFFAPRGQRWLLPFGWTDTAVLALAGIGFAILGKSS